jgi:hypothetical protein
MGAPVTIMISREEIVREDVSRVREILDAFVPTLIDRNRNRVIIMVNGFNEDPRELFLINEVRNWFHHLFDAVPEFFFWMDMSTPWLNFYAIMFGTPVRKQGGTTMSSEDLQRFLIWGYQNLNAFCSAHGISPDSSNEHIRRAIASKTES